MPQTSDSITNQDADILGQAKFVAKSRLLARMGQEIIPPAESEYKLHIATVTAGGDLSQATHRFPKDLKFELFISKLDCAADVRLGPKDEGFVRDQRVRLLYIESDDWQLSGQLVYQAKTLRRAIESDFLTIDTDADTGLQPTWVYSVSAITGSESRKSRTWSDLESEEDYRAMLSQIQEATRELVLMKVPATFVSLNPSLTPVMQRSQINLSKNLARVQALEQERDKELEVRGIDLDRHALMYDVFYSQLAHPFPDEKVERHQNAGPHSRVHDDA